VELYRQLPDARLFVAPDCDHQVMVTRPALFNAAAGGFYRQTEAIARARATGPGDATPTTIRSGGRAPVPTTLPQPQASTEVDR